jgi:putative ABC transport system permease protein
MNVFTRGVKNALRSPVRSGAIVLLLAVSIGLILSMLVARSSVSAKITEVKSTTATSITINPAGVQGFQGGGNPLTSANVATIKSVAHVTSTVETLSDQLASTDTNLTSSLNLGSFGARQARFSSSSDSTGSGSGFGGGSSATGTGTATAFTPRITVTGTSDPTSALTSAGKITSGATIDGSSSSYIALVGSDLATKNSLKVGSTFTAYGQTFTVAGIYTTGSTFTDSNIIMPLATVQNLSSQVGDVSSVVATADNSDDVSSVTAALKKALGTAADITSEQAEAAASVAPLQSIETLATTGVIAASIAGGIIVLLAMIMIVRERRREIGVIKAIGGTNGKVIAQFMIEGLTLTFIGAIVGLGLGVLVSGPMTSSLVSSSTSTTTATTAAGPGVAGGSTNTTRRAGGFGGGFSRAAGAGVSQLRTNLTQVTASLTPSVFGTAIAIIVGIAIIGTAIPAWFIARVRPAEVLRTGE